jgi:methylase of polypeptide subunit release factors
LAPGGTLVLEIGAGQADETTRLIWETTSLTMAGMRRDLQGIPRTVIARRT